MRTEIRKWKMIKILLRYYRDYRRDSIENSVIKISRKDGLTIDSIRLFIPYIRELFYLEIKKSVKTHSHSQKFYQNYFSEMIYNYILLKNKYLTAYNIYFNKNNL